jgi:hypothetical protein
MQNFGEIDIKNNITLKLIASLTLCDHMGNVAQDIETALKRLDMNDLLKEIEDEYEEADFFAAVQKVFAKKGITTLHDVDFTNDDRPY